MMSASAVEVLYPSPRRASTIALALGGAFLLLNGDDVNLALQLEHAELTRRKPCGLTRGFTPSDNPCHYIGNLSGQQRRYGIAHLVELLRPVSEEEIIVREGL
ncbi:hypothetical protein D9M68_912190 [compost metagenome]